MIISDPSVTDISINSLRHGDLVASQANISICRYSVYKKINPSFSATQLIVAPDTPAAVKSVFQFKHLECIFRAEEI